ncbi:MAG: hypothetical protein GF334_02555 [Candidatus Altiarchaeales archaeon]|nr:hypothetical protein [Candidatus Altiarchaeales archaeon]
MPKFTKKQRIKLARFALKHPEYKERVAALLSPGEQWDRRKRSIASGFQALSQTLLGPDGGSKDRIVDAVYYTRQLLEAKGYLKEAMVLNRVLNSVMRG